MSILLPEYEMFLERLETGLSKSIDLSKIPEWMTKNTRDPRNKRKRWSFDEHDFQLQIISDQSPEVAIRKCSQVGLSELAVRMTLAICYMRDFTGIYVLPTKSFASNFSKDRIDPVVDNSPTLSAQKHKDAYAVNLKKIGDMTLYVVGSFSPGDAISVPAQFLVRDEYDFGKQSILTTFDSRLGHNKEGEDFRRDFSTPTVKNFGIDRKFRAGHQAYYGVKHDLCGKWVVPNFMDHVVIPGFDGNARDLERYHLADPNVDADRAHLICPGCRREISIRNLADPTKRQWIAKHPDRDVHSYQVQPFDVPTINRPARTIKQLKDYALKKDWVNFKVGEVYEDNESAFNPAAVQTYQAGERLVWQPGQKIRTGCYIGIDVGAISWIVIGMRVGGRLRVVHLEQVICRGKEDALFKRVCELFQELGPAFGVIDSMPDFNTASKLCLKFPGRFLACEYADKLPSPLATLDVKEERSVVRAHKDKRFDLLVKEYNSGGIEWAPHPQLPIMGEHVQGMKKMRRADEESAASTIDENAAEHWEKTGDDDHYLHALNYMHIAAELQGTISIHDLQPGLPLAGRIKMKDGHEKERDKKEAQRRVLHVSSKMRR